MFDYGIDGNGGGSAYSYAAPARTGKASAKKKPVVAYREAGDQAGQRADELYQKARGYEQYVNEARNRYVEALGLDPFELANRAQGFLGQAAQGYAAQLLPELGRGLAQARSRFGGGGIRSGGAQQAEELAFQRLFSDPMQNKIAQLAGMSLQFGQSEAGRRADQYGRFYGQEIGREQGYYDVYGQAHNRYLEALGQASRQKIDKDIARMQAVAAAMQALGSAAGAAAGFGVR